MTASELSTVLQNLEGSDPSQLRLIWRNHLGGRYPAHLPKWLLVRVLAYRLQASVHGDLDASVLRTLRQNDRPAVKGTRAPLNDNKALTPGTVLVREWQGRSERVMVLEEGFAWNGQSWTSLSQVARAITGTNWNGHRFFGLQRHKRKAA